MCSRFTPQRIARLAHDLTLSVPVAASDSDLPANQLADIAQNGSLIAWDSDRDHAAANTRAHRDVDHVAGFSPRAVAIFGETRHVGVVADENRHAEATT